MNLRKILKKIPIDFGQREYRFKTRSSTIALELAGDGTQKKAIDLGCGEGFWTKQLKKQGWYVVPIDIAKEYSQAIVHDLNEGIPFPDNHFDLVFSTATLGYITDLGFFKKEITRVLKPEGKYIITTPNSAFWIEYLLKLFGSSLKKIQDPNQKHYLTMQEVETLFPKAAIYGYFPYMLLKFRILKMVSLLSPSFIIYGSKEKTLS